jgi:chromate transporter
MENKEYNLLSKKEKNKRQLDITKTFLKLGFLAFGGPAAHIAMLEEEAVTKKKWLDRDKFMDFFGATNLIPGPNSTEMVIMVGYEHGGVLGLINAGVSFILPAMLIVLLFASFYVNYGTLPQVGAILDGIKPVIMAIILNALYRLFRSVIDSKKNVIFGLIAALLYYSGFAEISLILTTGILMMLYDNRKKLKDKFFSISLPMIFFVFLKIGAFLYGSGYVLLAFLESEFVEKRALLTTTQLLDAVAVGQFTPGPVFTTATFIGYLLGSFPGAILATIGIFLPAFVVVYLIKPHIQTLRNSVYFSSILDGVNIASLVMMAFVSINLGIASLFNPVTVAIFLVSLILMTRFKVNSAILIILGGLINFIISVL